MGTDWTQPFLDTAPNSLSRVPLVPRAQGLGLRHPLSNAHSGVFEVPQADLGRTRRACWPGQRLEAVLSHRLEFWVPRPCPETASAGTFTPRGAPGRTGRAAAEAAGQLTRFLSPDQSRSPVALSTGLTSRRPDFLPSDENARRRPWLCRGGGARSPEHAVPSLAQGVSEGLQRGNGEPAPGAVVELRC
ncbi:hypothetical protein GHT09_015749 [Marmota monax]|uniref:Uncharacterized protein n=1 Tax=Marmota monax TaxID=9995 RepID=A0A834UJX1_MARMO|nr:hypothetical protein GHT09_015749 [Marmota monax]